MKAVFLGYLKGRLSLISDDVYNNLRDSLMLNTHSYNAEVKYLWFQVALLLKKEDVVEVAKKFLLTHGRMKYVRPVYFAWYPFQKEQCLEFFDKNK